MDEARRCTSKAKQTGDRCKRAAAPGATVCYIHGGGAPQVRAAGARRLQRDRLDGDLGRLLAELEVDAAGAQPVVLLLDAVHRCAAMVQVLGAVVGGLGADDLYGPDHLGDGRPHVATEMYATWLDRSARASQLAIAAGCEERLVRLAEAQGRLVADAIGRILGALGFDPGAPEVREIVRRELTLVSGRGS